MIGLARMAMTLAESRAPWSVKGLWSRHHIEPNPRALTNPAIHPYSAEYYAICDRIVRGEKP